MPQTAFYWATQALLAVGVPKAAAATIATLTINAAANTAIALGLNAAARALAGVPDVEAGKQVLNQPRPARRRAYGRVRLGGFRMLFEAKGNVLNQVIALHDGRIGGINQIYLHDDKVELGPPSPGDYVQALDDRTYAGEHIRIQTRLGLDTETAYSELAAERSDVWSASCRGDGIASAWLRTRNGPIETFARDYPNGPPLLTLDIDASPVWDWRDPTQDKDDPSTWLVSDNPIVCLVHELWRFRGKDWSRRFEPVLDILTDEADACDELIDRAAGGPTPRYAMGGFFETTNEPGAVIAKFLETMDGFMAERGDGAIVVRCGRYRAPTITFTDDHVVGYQARRFVPAEERVNVLQLSFTDPATDFNKHPVSDWRDEASIALHGEKTQEFYPDWCQDIGQLGRLAKRRFGRLNAPLRGTVTTNLYGLKALGERYLRLQISRRATLNDVVVEVVAPPVVDLMAQTVEFTWVQADPAIDAWDPETEEPTLVDPGERTPRELLAEAEIEGVTLILEETGFGAIGVRLAIQIPTPLRDDLTWRAQWRVQGADAWIDTPVGDPVSDVLTTGFVTANAILEVRIAYTTGGGFQTPWSEIETVSTAILILREADASPLLREDDTPYQREAA